MVVGVFPVPPAFRLPMQTIGYQIASLQLLTFLTLKEVNRYARKGQVLG